MTTKEIVAYIQKKASGFTSTEILTVLNEVHKYVLSNTVYQNEKVDTTTGMPPFLVTRNDTYEYDCPADCRRTLKIFTESPVGYSDGRLNGRIREYWHNRRQYYEIEVKSFDALQDTLARVIFLDNPTATTETYYHSYEVKPTELLSDAIQLDIPEKHHLRLVDGVLARIRDEKYGDKSDWQQFTLISMKAILNDMNQGAQLKSGGTPTRPENRFYARTRRF